MILIGDDVVVSSGRVKIPLRTVPKVPLPRNSPNSNCDGGIVDDNLCVNATVVPNNDDSDGGEPDATGGAKADTKGRRRTSSTISTSSIGHRRDGTMFFTFSDWTVTYFGVTSVLRKNKLGESLACVIYAMCVKDIQESERVEGQQSKAEVAFFSWVCLQPPKDQSKEIITIHNFQNHYHFS